ncbi:rCG50356 [Rattus norvegicus]|uniref:RCG50356 n=1 Tax=Rattus norvegicus TaxID=10116 RepID=A6JZ24_RAT|nr:rCG50356 [Rattus norvegicus]
MPAFEDLVPQSVLLFGDITEPLGAAALLEEYVTRGSL